MKSHTTRQKYKSNLDTLSYLIILPNLDRYEGTVDCEGIGREMERAAARMGGTTKWPYNDSDCLDADRFKTVADSLVS